MADRQKKAARAGKFNLFIFFGFIMLSDSDNIVNTITSVLVRLPGLAVSLLNSKKGGGQIFTQNTKQNG